MQRSREAAARIHEIETQQDEVLRRLEELEQRTQRALAEHLPPGGGRTVGSDGIDPSPPTISGDNPLCGEATSDAASA